MSIRIVFLYFGIYRYCIIDYRPRPTILLCHSLMTYIIIMFITTYLINDSTFIKNNFFFKKQGDIYTVMYLISIQWWHTFVSISDLLHDIISRHYIYIYVYIYFLTILNQWNVTMILRYFVNRLNIFITGNLIYQ